MSLSRFSRPFDLVELYPQQWTKRKFHRKQSVDAPIHNTIHN
jgi:hypothetical protein